MRTRAGASRSSSSRRIPTSSSRSTCLTGRRRSTSRSKARAPNIWFVGCLYGTLTSQDVEEVKAFLQQRWDIFDSFPKNLKTSLQANDLEQVNRVLGRMSVEQAEEIVGQLDQARILQFSQSGIVDTTKGETAESQSSA